MRNAKTKPRIATHATDAARGSMGIQVYEWLLAEIAAGSLRPGSILREMELSDRFKVSRTPVREALFRLKEHGLAVDDGRSVRIRTLSVRDITDLYFVRRALELTAVRRAWGRLTAEDFDLLHEADPRTDEDPVKCARYDLALHRTIADRSGNVLLAKTLRRLHNQVLLVCRPIGNRVAEHRAIIEALRTGDRRDAVRAMARHLAAAFRTQRATVRAMADEPISRLPTESYPPSSLSEALP